MSTDAEYPKTVRTTHYNYLIGPPIDLAVASAHMELGGQILELRPNDMVWAVRDRSHNSSLGFSRGTTMHIVLGRESASKDVSHLSDAQRYMSGYDQAPGKGHAAFIASIANLAKKAGRS